MTTIGYPYALPTTANVSLQEFVESDAQYQRPLSEATASRGRLRAALKEHKHSDRHDSMNVQKALEDYIPLLLGLVAGIENAELRLSHEVETTWRCIFSNVHLSSKQPRVKHKSIHYEAIFTLLTLGYVLMDRANEMSQAVQKRILVAIGDLSSYTGGYGDPTGGSGNSTPGSGMGAGGHGSGPGSGGGNNATSGGGGLFKKSSSIGSKSAKNPNTIGEFTDYLNDEALGAIDHQLTMAADLYCKAAGVFEYIAQEMIPRWNRSVAAAVDIKENNPGNNGNTTATTTLGLGKPLSSSAAMKALSESARPVDVQTCVVSSHMKLALAEAHACTVRKASIKAARASAIKLAASGGASANSTATTGASKTSYVLLAKLTIGIKEEYERAYGLLKSVKDLNDITTEYRNHVKDAKVYYEALALTLLGMDAYEAQQYGKAIGFMSLARASFLSLSKSSKAHTISQAAAFEYRLANEKVMAFQKINDSVTFEQVPNQTELLGLMPNGRDLLSIKKYVAPRPSFGSAATAGQGGVEDSVSRLSYALQGAYF
ncbi:hypothetical protein B0O80DRAFT_160150 [Mortierella sp. GBAus27b]|nr:hypothetical protein BGX31_009413 [Mortierella sp. GBA43]KAI8361475.1 hypothetical protein B0O80DRAFT_160150 [Mortierella sp. GBAus27b]